MKICPLAHLNQMDLGSWGGGGQGGFHRAGDLDGDLKGGTLMGLKGRKGKSFACARQPGGYVMGSEDEFLCLTQLYTFSKSSFHSPHPF